MLRPEILTLDPGATERKPGEFLRLVGRWVRAYWTTLRSTSARTTPTPPSGALGPRRAASAAPGLGEARRGTAQ